MEEPGIIQYVFALFPFLVLIYALLMVAAQSSKPKTNVEAPKEKPPEGSGWLYLIEREGHIKVGEHKFSDNGVEGLVDRLKSYIKSTSFPNTASVNVLYYQFYRGRPDFTVTDQETRMKHIIQGYAVEINAGEKNRVDYFNPKKKEEEEYVFRENKLVNPYTGFEKTKSEVASSSGEVDVVRMTKELNSMHYTQDQITQQVEEALKKIKENKAGELEGEMPRNGEVILNPYFLKVHRSGNAEWFKVADANHDERELKILYELMEAFADKSDLAAETIRNSNEAIFDRPRIFLSKPPS